VLFGEHTYLLAKLSVAAAGGHKDEYHSYAGVLASNSLNLTNLFAASMGQTEGAEFSRLWIEENNFFVDYLVATVTHDQASATAAISGLTGAYVPQMVRFLGASIQFPAAAGQQMATDQVTGTKSFSDDAVAGSLSPMYAHLLNAYTKAMSFGDAIAIRTAAQFADRYPGDATAKAVDLRANVDGVLQAEAYLLTMTTGATVAGNQSELTAARDAVAANTQSLATVFTGAFGAASGTQAGKVWDNETLLLIAYARSGDQAVQRNVIAAAVPPPGDPTMNSPDLRSAVTAVLHTVDDQRSKAYTSLADDDRAAAVQLVAIGDALTGA
jgi:hypothetical protein